MWKCRPPGTENIYYILSYVWWLFQ